VVWPSPVFTADGYTLTVNIVGDGSVTNNPDQATYHYGDVVTLTATADPGWTFSACCIQSSLYPAFHSRDTLHSDSKTGRYPSWETSSLASCLL
jgi:hypothetical protein